MFELKDNHRPIPTGRAKIYYFDEDMRQVLESLRRHHACIRRGRHRDCFEIDLYLLDYDKFGMDTLNDGFNADPDYYGIRWTFVVLSEAVDLKLLRERLCCAMGTVDAVFILIESTLQFDQLANYELPENTSVVLLGGGFQKDLVGATHALFGSIVQCMVGTAYEDVSNAVLKSNLCRYYSVSPINLIARETRLTHQGLISRCKVLLDALPMESYDAVLLVYEGDLSLSLTEWGEACDVIRQTAFNGFLMTTDILMQINHYRALHVFLSYRQKLKEIG